MAQSSFLVVGARGRVGREVVRALAARGASVRALVRASSASPPSLPGVREVVGDLRNRASLERALAGVEGAFFVTPHDPDEEQLGTAFVEAAGAAGVRRIVFASAYHWELRTRLGMSMFVAAMSAFTHYGPKLRVEQRVRLSSMSPVVLMPSNFYQNDETFLPELRQGRYPQPLGNKGVNRVDCRDIGDAAARALTDSGIASGGYPLLGPEIALTGAECAAAWSRALGRDVAYEGDIDAWYALVAERLHAREREDFAKTYRLFSRMRVAASPAELERTAHVVGHAPRSYAAYVEELARAV